MSCTFNRSWGGGCLGGYLPPPSIWNLRRPMLCYRSSKTNFPSGTSSSSSSTCTSTSRSSRKWYRMWHAPTCAMNSGVGGANRASSPDNTTSRDSCSVQEKGSGWNQCQFMCAGKIAFYNNTTMMRNWYLHLIHVHKQLENNSFNICEPKKKKSTNQIQYVNS